jgi:hypothetical protein
VLPDISSLGNYPLLQFMAGLLMIFVVSLAWVRGQAQPPPPATQPGPQPEQRIYLDGPLLKIIEALQEVAAPLKRIETGTAEEIRVIGDIEHRLKSAIEAFENMVSRLPPRR